MLKTINSKRILLLVLTALLYIFPANAQYTTHCVFLDLGKHPVYIDGVLSGTTNKLIEVDCGTRYIVIQRGKRFYGRYVNIDAYRRDIDISAAPRIYGYEPNKTSNYESSLATNSNISNTSSTNNGYTSHKSQTRVSNSINAKHLSIFCENGKYGYKDNNGTVAIKAKYQYAEPFIDELNCAIVKRGNKYGIINAANKFIVKPQYQELTYIHNNHFLIKKDGKYGVIDLFNNIIIAPYCSEIVADSKFYVCQKYGNWHIINHKGKTMLITCYHIKYVGASFAVLKDEDSNKQWFQHFSREQQDVFDLPNDFHYPLYDDVTKLSNNTYLMSANNEYYFAGIDGKIIEAAQNFYIDVKKWEREEWQYAPYRNRKGGCYIRYHIALGIEELSLDSFLDKFGNPWEEVFSTQYVDKYSENENCYISNYLGLSPLYSPTFPEVDDTITENNGGDSYVHYLFRSIDLGEFSFRGLKHITEKKNYLYVSKSNTGTICKKIAYSEFATFADLSGADIQINGITILSNGDILLKAKANIVTGYDTYMRDPVYINIQGQLVAIDNGGTYRNYHRDDVTVVFVLDGKTFDLKHSRIMPHEYDNIYVSEYNGFFAYKSDYYGNFTITTENPILKFTNSCREDWSFAPSVGEGINCMVENSEYIYMGGYTKNKGYVGYKNPYICKLDLKTGTIIKSHSYKLKDGSITLFEGDCAFTNLFETRTYNRWHSSQYSFSLLDSFEEGDIEIINVTFNEVTYTGLVYDSEYWLIPPVLPGQDIKTYGGWTIYPPTIKYDNSSKKIVQGRSKTTKNNEKVSGGIEIITH